MELLQNRSGVFSKGSSGDAMSSCVLDQFIVISEEDHGGENYISPDKM